ncbi:MAG: zinc-ribbon domain-containing protein, partial [Lachnospiraceae bacterium]|nr:zinc-ribbon domain-containing protein [Lachnospiraceae bacterium]
MKTCPKCGNQLPDDAAFCNNCGEKMAVLAADAAATTAENVAPVPVP